MLKEHQQKSFVKLSRFDPLRGWVGLGKSVTKAKFVMKIFVQIMLSKVLKSCKKWCKSLCKTTRSGSTGTRILYLFIKSAFKTWNTMLPCKTVMYFSFHLACGIPFSLILSVLHKGQNPQRVTKIVRWQSLNWWLN